MAPETSSLATLTTLVTHIENSRSAETHHKGAVERLERRAALSMENNYKPCNPCQWSLVDEMIRSRDDKRALQGSVRPELRPHLILNNNHSAGTTSAAAIDMVERIGGRVAGVLRNPTNNRVLIRTDFKPETIITAGLSVDTVQNALLAEIGEMFDGLEDDIESLTITSSGILAFHLKKVA